ncbi:hypothetical protein OG589_14520 [Sphaerisporangium sp. NBC_01403]|uniref:hypothetical protein n=1 Tax=Sphaerisporangium sp. NBC_01403 TaxID=2903599 RepID=UPI0032499D8A
MSTIPAALAALVAAARRAWPDVQVLDGGPTIDINADVISIGYSGSTTDADVRSTLTRDQLDVQPDLERYDVMCMVSAWRGDAYDADGKPDAETTRLRAFELLAGFRRELARDPRLGGTVMMAHLSTLDMVADQTPSGPVCTVRFVVHVDAFTDA